MFRCIRGVVEYEQEHSRYLSVQYKQKHLLQCSVFVILSMPRQNSGTQAELGETEQSQSDTTRKESLHTLHYRDKDLVTVDGPLATYKGYVAGSDPIVGPNGSTIVFVTEVVEITDEVPEWAITPEEKIGTQSRFSPQCVNETAS